jgi:hypothetical protein
MMAKAYVSGATVLSMVIVLAGCGAANLPSFLSSPPSESMSPPTSAATGEWTGTVSYEWTRHNVVTATDSTETTDEMYSAHTQITSQAVDIDRWKLTGQGNVVSSRSIVSDFTVGNCHNHFEDAASASSAVVVPDGGVEIDGNRYQIRIEIPGITGSESTVRLTCPPQDDETHDWEVAEYTVLESGTMTDTDTISGSETDEDGRRTTWDLHRAP